MPLSDDLCKKPYFTLLFCKRALLQSCSFANEPYRLIDLLQKSPVEIGLLPPICTCSNASFRWLVQKCPITVCSFAKEPYYNLLFCKRAQLIVGSYAKEPCRNRALAANTHVLQRLWRWLVQKSPITVLLFCKEPCSSFNLLQTSPIAILLLCKRALSK